MQIEKLVVGGEGLARVQGAVIFIPFSAPGDELLIEITAVKKNFYRGKLVEILLSSKQRVPAKCEYFGACGGCQWQHLDYDLQLETKRNFVAENLRKFLSIDTIPFEGIVASPHPWRYRNRIQPQYSTGQLGFMASNTSELIPIEDCLIADEKLIQLWPKIKEHAQKNLTKHPRYEVYLDRNQNAHFYEMQEDKQDLGFSQVNESINQLLIQRLLDWSCLTNPKRIIDLYAGAGNLTFPLSDTHKKSQVIGVELHPFLVQKARQQSENRKISPKYLDFYTSDVGHFLKRFELKSDDMVILDPPRAGADAIVLKSLAHAGVEKILYVSCHPVSLGRDLKYLFDFAQQKNITYELTRVIAFDMFPQTDHVETLVEVVRKTP